MFVCLFVCLFSCYKNGFIWQRPSSDEFSGNGCLPGRHVVKDNLCNKSHARVTSTDAKLTNKQKQQTTYAFKNALQSVTFFHCAKNGTAFLYIRKEYPVIKTTEVNKLVFYA